MDPTLLKIAAAALLHDIGKFADRDALTVSEQFMLDHADLYQPFNRKTGRHTHQHAVCTAAFLERLRELLPPEFSARQWGDGEPLINLAAGHHRPEDHPLRWIITEADRLSSGWERRRDDSEEGEASAVDPREYQKTRLAAILAELTLPPEAGGPAQGAPHPPPFGYPLRELSPESIFPRPLKEVAPVDRKVAAEEYLRLFEGFQENLGRLAHRQENLELWLEHLDSLLMVFTAMIPAQRAGEVEASRDVSLYDHARTTAALAAALYAYHRQRDSLTVPATRDASEPKFLFINGDFYGIQDFIFSSGGQTRRYRAKLLRGRSFAVSLMTELAADLVCRELGLPFVSVVLSAAGKFTILAPNTNAARQAVDKAEREINEWLFRISLGESALGLATRPASPHDLLEGRFTDLWEGIGRDLERRKLRRLDLLRHGGEVAGYLENFSSLCPLCFKRAATLAGGETGQDPYLRQVPLACTICRDHIFLGTNLVKKNRLAVTTPQTDLRDKDQCLREPLFGRYQVAFVDGFLTEEARKDNLLRLWDISPPQETLASPVTRKFINGYIPECSEADLHDDRLKDLEEKPEPGAPKNLEQLAALALSHTDTPGKFQGLEALGVLKADVDNLGLLMTCGLPPEKFTLSRLATLSRQVHFFFCLHLPHLLASRPQFQDTYTVFAGGDDLFLLGPWNRLHDLAREIQKQFTAYVGGNPAVHLSAGMALKKPHTPLDQMARSTEAALHQAKAGGRNRLTVFGETVPWAKVGELDRIKETLTHWLVEDWFTAAMLYRLNEFITLADEEQRLMAGRTVHLNDLACLKWRAYLAYFSGRNVARNLKGEARDQVAAEVHQKLALWLSTYGGTLRMPLWELLYERR
ncbi:MAG: type III-A CRISPR-associated protein Cas10/Csm1 [Deltaproteobacteria bacterium]|nr:type III-A CRISPR-associated protein Cas10/Csm1 [Deltaproteobacteria bacterium]